MLLAACAASSKPALAQTFTPHVPLTLHVGLLRCGLFEAKTAKTVSTNLTEEPKKGHLVGTFGGKGGVYLGVYA